MLKRFFKKKSMQAGERYEKVAVEFEPMEDLDPCTWEMLRMTANDVLGLYQSESPVAETEDALQLWQNEVMRLVVDGYLLGRIEDDTEGKHLRFDQSGANALREVVEFGFVVERAITAGLQSGSYSGPPASDIAELLASFTRQAIEPLLGHASNARSMGEALGRCVHTGREIALLEGFYLNPTKRDDLLKIRASLTEREKGRSIH